MKNILFIALIISSLSLAGQTQFIGIKAGMNCTEFSGDNLPMQTSYLRSMSFGFLYEKVIQNKVYLAGEVLYLKRGYKDSGEMIYPPSLGRTDFSYKGCLRYDYLAIPLKVGYTLGDKLFAFSSLGIIPSYLIDIKRKWKSEDMQGESLTDTSYSIKPKYRFDLAGLIELGGGYKLNDKYSIFTSFTYQYSITPIYYQSENAPHHYGFNWSVGVKRSFTK